MSDMSSREDTTQGCIMIYSKCFVVLRKPILEDHCTYNESVFITFKE